MFFISSIKICGLTSKSDVDYVGTLGADYFGFIVYSKSPRAVRLDVAASLAAELPLEKRVIVDVETSPEALMSYCDAGFGCFQIHCEGAPALKRLEAWAAIVGPERLWLAPRLAPGEPFPENILPFARTILLDTYRHEQVGGTGQTGDWASFARWRAAYPETKFILAGGLNPDNCLPAIELTGARHLDINSGVESAPGQKDPAKLAALFKKLRP